MDQATQDPTPEELLLRTGVRARRDTLRADLFAGGAARARAPQPPPRPTDDPQPSGRYRTPEWLERSFVLPVQPRPSWPSSSTEAPGLKAPECDPPGLAARLADARRPAHADPIDLCALVRRGDVFRRMRAASLACAILVLAILLAYALTGIGALLPALCLLVSAGFGATYVAMRLANAPLPRVRR